MFDHPSNAISMAKRHQGELLQKEQMEQLARKVEGKRRGYPDWVAAVLHQMLLLRTRTSRATRLRARRQARLDSAPPLATEDRG